MVNWTGPGPGERSTELVLAQDRDSWKETIVSTDQDAVLRRHRNPRCARCVTRPISNPPLLGKEYLDTNPDTTLGALRQGGMRQIQ